MKSFYAKWWHAGNASIIVSGDTTQAEIQPLLEARFGKWAKGAGNRLAVEGPKVPAKTRIVFAEQPGAVQSVIVAGTPGVARASDDYIRAMVAGTAIAGMFSSPLNLNLREAHGWSYGIYGSFSESRDWGVFRVAGSVQADKTAPAVVEVLGELNKTTLAAPTAELLTLAKDSVRKSLAGNFETNRATVAAFEAVPAFGLPLDLWATLPSQSRRHDRGAGLRRGQDLLRAGAPGRRGRGPAHRHRRRRERWQGHGRRRERAEGARVRRQRRS